MQKIRPALSAFLAVCVLALGFAAVSPELHELICIEEGHHHHGEKYEQDVSAGELSAAAHHHHEAPGDDEDDQDCAVHLFAHGCTSSSPVTFVSPGVLTATQVAHFTEFMLARTLRGPARVCGPPALA